MLYRPPKPEPEEPARDWLLIVCAIILFLEFWTVFLMELAALAFHH
jgi:hypothetical protein